MAMTKVSIRIFLSIWDVGLVANIMSGGLIDVKYENVFWLLVFCKGWVIDKVLMKMRSVRISACFYYFVVLLSPLSELAEKRLKSEVGTI